jgi:invasion protein IalB
LANMMAIKCSVFLLAIAACGSSALAQEESAATRKSADEARWQKECVDKANYDKLGTDRRPTFMIQCAAGAKLDSSSKPASQK